ncbi:hypothetical protein B0A55_01785 [Friedmanniomyces simplex]|uniref:AMP-activated protein kinase glycogen-binding domain-containing protein n=1 Tax=Friedmanniomyces simplex TaxID=329884 RepID=A0A4U0XY81_9PEZI|nr:hypothetical protein B0A55_01785 [Friedmanniomyces simplex]
MSSPTKPTVNDLKASFEARSRPTTTTITFARPPELQANKMSAVKLTPAKPSIDSVLDTANSAAPKGTSTVLAAEPTPPTPPTTPTDLGVPTAAAATNPPPAASSATTAAPPAVASEPTATAVASAAPTPPPPTPISSATPAVAAPPAADPPPAPRPALAPPARPAATQKPSWIGPPRPAATTPTMTHPATVEYTSKGLQPPVYVFTSLSDPQWDAVEMDHDKRADGENRFYKTFTADEGDYQYKFRLGPGDWWALDDAKPTVDDGAGNKNNLMVVKPVTAAPQAPEKEPAKAVDAPVLQQPAASSPPQQVVPPVSASPPAPLVAASPPQQVPQIAVDSMPSAAPLMPHEQLQPSEKPAANTSSPLPAVASAVTPEMAPLLPHERTPLSEKPTTTPLNPLSPAEAAAAPPMAPLMKHESSLPEIKDGSPYRDMDDDNDDANLVERDDDDDGIYEHRQHPLLRHETLGPDADEHTHSPLFRHESMTLGLHNDEPDHTYAIRSRTAPAPLSLTSSGSSSSSSSSAADSFCPEADPNDPSLEKFPTDPVGIWQHIHRASTQLPADETGEDVNARAPASVPLMVGGREREREDTPSLFSVKEEDEDEEEEEEEEEVEELRKQERLQAEREVENDEVDPLAEGGLPQLTVTEPNDSAGLAAAAALLTPPMTPGEAEKVVERVLEAAEVERIDEGIAAAEIDAAQRNGNRNQTPNRGAKQEDLVLESVQDWGGFGAVVDVLTHPMSLLALAGLALAVAAGAWKLRERERERERE